MRLGPDWLHSCDHVGLAQLKTAFSHRSLQAVMNPYFEASTERTKPSRIFGEAIPRSHIGLPRSHIGRIASVRAR